jgi:TATA-box binding protein (TBP) (component of TFIID and TFIIIB)
MADEIINRVVNSKLITIDLADFIPKGPRKIIYLSDWLFENIILKEVDFRAKIATHDWQQYQGVYVVIVPAEDAIVPSWAYLLITTQLTSIAKNIIIGDEQDLEYSLLITSIEKFDFSIYKNGLIVIKGCSNFIISNNAYALLIQKLRPHVKSIMFGEACSNVPIFKK